MDPAAVMDHYRREAGLTQQELAARLNIGYSTYRGYVSRDMRLPHDVAARAAQVLRAPEILFALCAQCPVNCFVSLVDSDDHPAAQLLNLLEETREGLAAVECLDMRRIRSLTDEETRQLRHAGDQVMDMLLAGLLTLASWWRHYNVNPSALLVAHRRKLGRIGLVREEAVVA